MRHHLSRLLLAAVFTLGALAHGTAGAASTALHPTYRVAAHATNSHNLNFNEHHPVHMHARGKGNTDLDLYVYDHHGRQVAHDDDGTDDCVCTFTPVEGATYRVVVINRGHSANTYELYYEMAE